MSQVGQANDVGADEVLEWHAPLQMTIVSLVVEKVVRQSTNAARVRTRLTEALYIVEFEQSANVGEQLLVERSRF